MAPKDEYFGIFREILFLRNRLGWLPRKEELIALIPSVVP